MQAALGGAGIKQWPDNVNTSQSCLPTKQWKCVICTNTNWLLSILVLEGKSQLLGITWGHSQGLSHYFKCKKYQSSNESSVLLSTSKYYWKVYQYQTLLQVNWVNLQNKLITKKKHKNKSWCFSAKYLFASVILTQQVIPFL